PRHGGRNAPAFSLKAFVSSRFAPHSVHSTRRSVDRDPVPVSIARRSPLPFGHRPPLVECTNSNHGNSSMWPAEHATTKRAGTVEGAFPGALVQFRCTYRARSGRYASESSSSPASTVVSTLQAVQRSHRGNGSTGTPTHAHCSNGLAVSSIHGAERSRRTYPRPSPRSARIAERRRSSPSSSCCVSSQSSSPATIAEKFGRSRSDPTPNEYMS